LSLTANSYSNVKHLVLKEIVKFMERDIIFIIIRLEREVKV